MRLSSTTEPRPHIMHGRVIYLLAIIALIQTFYPITENAPSWVLIGFQFLYLLQIVAGILVVRDSPRSLAYLIGLGILWAVAAVAYALNQTSLLAQLGAYAAIALYQAMVIGVLLRFIFTTRRIDLDVIYAACAIYLLVGAVFVGIFGSLDVLTLQATGAHAFRDSLLPPDAVLPWQHLVYYSYITLTTVGYGDVLPVTLWARAFATLEATIGVLYLTVIVARLVGLYASKEVEEELRQE
ncbi:MAG: two pore domain potassium channel family protein [Anaerolineae bacterium]|nr:two pore domain potassium channel family protein [Anaerolineae bacterium]